MISLRMVDGIKFDVHSDKIEEFTTRFESALEYNEVIEIERPEDKHLRYINPHQILYYELKEG